MQAVNRGFDEYIEHYLRGEAIQSPIEFTRQLIHSISVPVKQDNRSFVSLPELIAAEEEFRQAQKKFPGKAQDALAQFIARIVQRLKQRPCVVGADFSRALSLPPELVHFVGGDRS